MLPISEKLTLQQLNQHFGLIEERERLREILESLKASAEPKAQRFAGMPHGTDAQDITGNLAAAIVDFEEQIRQLDKEIEQEEAAIRHFIRGIDDVRTRTVFRLRYLCGMTWKEVAAYHGKWSTENKVQKLCYRYLDKIHQQQE